MTTTGPADRPPIQLGANRNRSFLEHFMRILFMACAGVTVITTVGIALILLFEAIQFFRMVSVGDFVSGTEWEPVAKDLYGVLPLVAGTVTIAALSALISIPLGLAAAIYLSEYATSRVRGILKPVLEILAGVPTVVYGFFALKFITPELLMPLDVFKQYNGLAAAIAVGIMALPTVASLSEDAIGAVPRSLREAAYGLGATKFETTVKVIVPAAISGIAASFILAISRAIGETMIVLVAAGSKPAGQVLGSRGLWDFTHDMQTMTGFIATMVNGDQQRSSPQFMSLFGVALLLFIMTFAMNLVSQWIANRYREEYE